MKLQRRMAIFYFFRGSKQRKYPSALRPGRRAAGIFTLFAFCFHLFFPLVSSYSEEKKGRKTISASSEPEPEKTEEKGEKEENLEKLLEKLQKKEQKGKRPLLAIVSLENKTGMKLPWLSSNALDSLTVHFVERGTYEVVERAKLDSVMAEQGLSAAGFVDEKSATKVGALLGAEIVVMGSIASLAFVGKPKQAFVEMSIRGIEVKTGSIVFAIKARGASGKIEASEDALIQKALDHAIAILMARLPVKIERVLPGGYVLLPSGKRDGIGPDSVLSVIRDGREIGTLKIVTIHEKSLEGQFQPREKGIGIQLSDLVVNQSVQDAQLPGAKGKKSRAPLFVGVGVVVVLVALGLGGGGGSKPSVEEPNVPPPPPPGKLLPLSF